MFIKEVRLRNFRNYEDETIKFSERVNVLLGDNAQGKTNILESLMLLSSTRSHRTNNDQAMIQYDKDCAIVSGIISDERDRQLTVILHDKGKSLLINKQPVKKSSEFIGLLNVIVFDPTDLNIFITSPLKRRNFINLELMKVSRMYLISLNKYNGLLKERNQYLKSRDIKDDYLDVLDEQLAECAEVIMKERKELIDSINDHISSYYQQISNSTITIQCLYKTSLKELTKEAFIEMMKNNRQKDKDYGVTLLGIHHDDLGFLMDGKIVEDNASQGQRRMIVLALKLALASFIEKKTHKKAVLLLDDVLSELDDKVQKQLLLAIPNDMQTVITTTEFHESLKLIPVQVQRIKHGKKER
ncbi:MAG: DNA replication/repair protein RecF [Erysipelotrichaceae bacterium]|nr:DNA replication/repair protein RecF [Erysipelotrichaceae bacterium]